MDWKLLLRSIPKRRTNTIWGTGVYTFDTEANSLIPDLNRWHCLCFKPMDENRFFIFCDIDCLGINEETGEEYREQFERTYNARFFPTKDYIKLLESPKTKEVIAHNCLGFDFLAMKKLDGVEYGVGPDFIGKNKNITITDSLVLSRYLAPDRRLPAGCPKSIPKVGGGSKKIGPHSLDSWSYRTGIAKPTVVDWETKPLHVYVHRCCEDVLNNEAVYHLLEKEKADVAISNGDKKGQWEIPLRMAHKVYYMMCEQEITGVCFDKEGAEELLIFIDKEMKEIAETVEPQLGERDLPKGKQPKFPKLPWKKPFDTSKPFTKKGKLKKAVVDYLTKIGYKTEEDMMELLKEAIVKNEENGKESEGMALDLDIEKELSASGIAFCNKFGITDEQQMKEEIKSIESGDREIRKLTEPIKLANQDSIKQFFIHKVGWIPTLWKTKNLLIDIKTKKNFSEEDQDKKIKKYIADLRVSPYRQFILRKIGYKREPDYDSKVFYSKIKRLGRNIPSSPQLKDTRGNLCPNLEKLQGDTAKLIVKWLSYRNRRTTIKSFDKDTGWLNNKRLGVDGRLPARSTGITNTTRQKHHIICNIPAPTDSVLLGKKMRGLFIAPKNYCCVGTDCCGIEGRAMGEAAWNFDGGAYAKEVLDGDVHTKNAKAFSNVVGREISRGEGKSPFYAGIYGCQAEKMADLLGVDKEKGGRIIDALWSVAPGLKACKDALEKYWESTGKKYIMAVNGMKIFTRSRHSLLNAYLQSTDAILMDWSCCWIDSQIKKRCLDAKRWIYYHDEVNIYNKIKDLEIMYFPLENKPEERRDDRQYSKPKIFRDGEVLHFEPKEKKTSDQWIQWYSEVGEICVISMRKAGEYFNFRVPLDGQYIVGNSWGETH